MSRPSAQQPPPPVGRAPMHTVQVLRGGSAGTGTHVRSLAAGLVARGLRVTVCAPASTQQLYDFTGTGARFTPARIRTDPEATAALRRVCEDADLVHAHGLRAGLLSALALGGRRRRTPLVVTWHTRGCAEGNRARLMRLLERRVARAAVVVLGASTDLVDRARRRGARDARLAPVAVPAPRRPRGSSPGTVEERLRHKSRAEIGAVERPLVLSVGRLARHQGYDTVLTAARSWRALDPPPLLAVVGEGPERAALQQRIDDEDLPVRLLGHRDDAAELLAGADVALIPSSWEARAVLAQEALHEGVPLVATAVGAVPELVGHGALLVPYGDAAALSAAVAGLVADPERRAALAERGLAQAATWPKENDTVAQVLSVYDELTTG